MFTDSVTSSALFPQFLLEITNKESLQQNLFVSLSTYSCLLVQGENAEKFLQGQVTCDVSNVTATQCQFTAICNHQGRVLATFYLIKKNQDYLLIVPKSIAADLQKHLQKFAVFSKVTIEDITMTKFLIGAIGKDIVQSLGKYFSTLPEKVYQVITDTDVELISLPGFIPRYLLLMDVQSLLCDISSTYDERHWKIISILSGYPAIYQETAAMVTPHMLDLHLLHAISFNKGCYVGQEIVARTHYLGKSKRHLYIAVLRGQEANPGDPLNAKGLDVGVLIDKVPLRDGTSVISAVLQENASSQEIICNNLPVKNVTPLSEFNTL